MPTLIVLVDVADTLPDVLPAIEAGRDGLNRIVAEAVLSRIAAAHYGQGLPDPDVNVACVVVADGQARPITQRVSRDVADADRGINHASHPAWPGMAARLLAAAAVACGGHDTEDKTLRTDLSTAPSDRA